MQNPHFRQSGKCRVGFPGHAEKEGKLKRRRNDAEYQSAACTTTHIHDFELFIDFFLTFSWEGKGSSSHIFSIPKHKLHKAKNYVYFFIVVAIVSNNKYLLD